MDLALTTTLPPPVLFGERVEHLPRINPETSAFNWAPGKRSFFIKDAVSLDKRPANDMEARKDFSRPLNRAQEIPTWVDYYLRNAMMTYFKIAGEWQPPKPLVDLYA
jgi:hypothetical protein